MNSNGFLKWLFSEAGAGWVLGFVSLILFVVSQLGRKPPRRLVFRETSISSLVRIGRAVKERITVTFEDRVVEGLSQLEVDIFNSGAEVIRNASLSIRFPNAEKILDVSAFGEFGDQTCQVEIKENNVRLQIPYLNPVRSHNHTVRVAFLIDGSFDGLQVAGGGEGWSLQHDPRETSDKLFRRRIRRFAWVIVIVLTYQLAYSLVVIVVPNTQQPESIEWLPVLLGLLPPFLVVGGVYVWGVRSGILPSLRRVLSGFKLLIRE